MLFHQTDDVLQDWLGAGGFAAWRSWICVENVVLGVGIVYVIHQPVDALQDWLGAVVLLLEGCGKLARKELATVCGLKAWFTHPITSWIWFLLTGWELATVCGFKSGLEVSEYNCNIFLVSRLYEQFSSRAGMMLFVNMFSQRSGSDIYMMVMALRDLTSGRLAVPGNYILIIIPVPALQARQIMIL